MVSTQEIVERSLYMSLLSVAINKGCTLDPEDYLDNSGMPNEVGEARYNADKAKIKNFVYIFGVGNNQDRGIKVTPRIVLNLQGYYPGLVGMERFQMDNTDKDHPKMINTGYTTKDITIDVHLVSKNQRDIRLLHEIMYTALPSQGYIKPFYNDREKYFNSGLQKRGNIYLEVSNYYNHDNTEHGLIEKVYQYKLQDCIVPDDKANIELVPIKDIQCLIGTYDQPSREYLEINIPKE